MFAIYNGKYLAEYATDVSYSLDVANYCRFIAKTDDYLQFYYNSLDGEFKSYSHYYIATHFLDTFNLSTALDHLKKAIDIDNNSMAHEKLADIYRNVIMDPVTATITQSSSNVIVSITMDSSAVKIPWATSQEIAEVLYNNNLLTQFIDTSKLKDEVLDKIYSNIIAAARSCDSRTEYIIDYTLKITNMQIYKFSNEDITNIGGILKTTFDAVFRCLNGQHVNSFADSFWTTYLIPFIRTHIRSIAKNIDLIHYFGKSNEYRAIFAKILDVNMKGYRLTVDYLNILIVAILCTEPDYVDDSNDIISNNKSDIMKDYISKIEISFINNIIDNAEKYQQKRINNPYSITYLYIYKNYSHLMQIVYHIVNFSKYLITNNDDMNIESIKDHKRSIVSAISTYDSKSNPQLKDILRIMEYCLGYNQSAQYLLLIKFPELVNDNIVWIINTHFQSQKLFIGARITNFSKIIDICPVCLENNVLGIGLDCFSHYVCVDCYPGIEKMRSCPTCRAICRSSISYTSY